ncbi:hypothetical protein FQA39_LY05553 [Lamprigera yunnana]|nr:hypothetical protein FQA39_LY05553 [Lamprigera yunnana]
MEVGAEDMGFAHVVGFALYESTQDTDGLYTEIAKLNFILTRGDLKARYVCQVTSAALPQPIVAHLDMDVHVKPLYMKLEYQEQVVQGNDVQLICDVFGANPAANVKWFNNSKLITNESLVHTVPEAMRNGTFTTKSQLQFKATRFDNGQIFHCYAENSVIRNQDSLFHKQVLIQVKFAPVVSVNPENTTTNESSQNILIGCRYTANPMELKTVYWMKNGKNLTLTKDKYQGGTALHPPLLIKNVTRDDMGEYVCVCMNDVGVSESENSAYLNVQYPPTVEVIMDPETPVKAVDGVNVTAMCNVVAGNPPSLLKVRWSLGSDLLKELPECNYTSNDVDGYGGLYCNVDPSILSLVTVDQSFAGNYTCRGMNVFGWGALSEPTELVVYYPPSSAKLTFYPSNVIKRGQVELQCSVEREGRPKNLTYIWYRGIHKMSGESSSKLTINPVKLDTRNNFTCIASNEGGISEPATVFINVSAPPAFITPLTYQHVRSFQPNMSLTCRVECSPLCYISWFRENEQIDTRNNPLYDIKTTIRDANGKTGDFESIESTLIWNVNAWPTHPFAKTAPTVHYMCMSSSNGVGNGVNASVPVEVEYPPENLTLTNYTISVVEGKFPPEVTCTGKGFPHLHYFWKKQNSSKILSYTQGLLFEAPVTKADSGSYVCEANNTHGTEQAVLLLEVQYPPQCVLTKGEYNGQPALLCIVNANPSKVSFNWKIQGANDTNDEQLTTHQRGIRGFLLLDSGTETLRRYQCYANNSAGTGNRCSIDVIAYQEQSSQIGAPGEVVSWWYKFGSGNNLILIAIIIGIILCAIFVCIIIIIIICVCKRRRARNKYNNPVELEEREKPDGYSPETTNFSKWPLKPGVLVHVNSMRNLSSAQISPETHLKTRQSPNKSCQKKYAKSKSKVYARLEKLRDILRLGDHDFVPHGVYHSPGGVVTFKRFENPPHIADGEQTTVTRKRKRPGYVPNQSIIADRGRPHNDGLTDPLTTPDKGFYENLPFHGMQTPPNKPVSIITPFIQGNTRNYPKPISSSTKIQVHPHVLSYNGKCYSRINRPVQRHQSFHGFGTDRSRALVIPQTSELFKFQPQLPSMLYTSPQNVMSNSVSTSTIYPNGNFPINRVQSVSNFSDIPCQKRRVAGRREQINTSIDEPENLRKHSCMIQNSVNTLKSTQIGNVNEKRFGSLELKKHKCYSPTFYSMRCKKHSKRSPLIYAVPKKSKSRASTKNVAENTKPEDDVFVFKNDKTNTFQDLTDSIQIMEQNIENNVKQNSLTEISTPKPAPRCKRHRKNSCHVYENVSALKSELENLDSSNNSSVNGVEISVTEALVHNSTPDNDIKINTKENLAPNSDLKRSPTVKISPNFIKTNTVNTKNIELHQKDKTSTIENPSPNTVEKFLIPEMPLLETQNKWTPALSNTNQNAFYTLTTPHFKQVSSPQVSQQYAATIPHQKHMKLIPRALFQDQQLSKSKSFSSKSKQKKHFQIPLQKCHSFKFQTAESYFQPIKNVHEENLMRNGYVSDFGPGYNDRYHNRTHHKKDKYKNKGPLVLRRPSDYQDNANELRNMVQLQYPQPLYCKKKDTSSRPNGIVYADLDIPKSSNSSNKQGAQSNSSHSKLQKSKAKTEYATLNFNEVGKEIDV